MNPGEQSSNPLGGKSSRYFGNRPRRTGNTRRFGAPQQSQYINQQPSFSMPMPAQMPAPQRKRSKKPLVIGVLAIAIIAVIIVVAVTIVPKAVETIGKNSSLSDLKNLIATYKDSVKYYENYYITEQKNAKIKLNNLYYYDRLPKEKTDLEQNMNQILEFREKLKEFGGLKEEKANEILVKLKQSMDRRIDYYKQFQAVYGGAIDVAINNGKTEYIDAFKKAANSDKGNEFAALLTSFFEADNALKDEGSKSLSSEERKMLSKQRSDAGLEIISSKLIEQIMIEKSAKLDNVEDPITLMAQISGIGETE